MAKYYLSTHEVKVDNRDPFKKFHVMICDITPTNDPCEIEDDAVMEVLDEFDPDGRFSFADSEWIDDRTVEVTAFYF